jgi:hypothetical protein
MGVGKGRRQLQHGDTRVAGRGKPQRVAEPQVQVDQAAPLLAADLKELLVRGGAKPLFGYGGHVKARGPEHRRGAAPEVFVELELHREASAGMSKTRSRAISAP